MLGIKTKIQNSKLYYKYWEIPRIERLHNHVISAIRKKNVANVLFIASNLPMWRYQNLFTILNSDLRFNAKILLVPFAGPIAEQENSLERLRAYFDKLKIPYIDTTLPEYSNLNVRKDFSPDIMFYQQPYGDSYDCNKYECIHFYDKLLCYYPYSHWMIKEPFGYNTRYHNLAWKIFQSDIVNYRNAQEMAYNNASNVVVVGAPNADNFLRNEFNDVWKIKDRSIKRIIWAPHFTIFPSTGTYVTHSCFLEIAENMLSLAKDYTDKIQIAFKPHPELKTRLYQHPNWGKKRADLYYEEWDKISNGQLEDGDYIDLFMTSDAMIHDCSSFTIEYHFTNNPVLFISKDIDAFRSTLNEVGKDAIDLHYKATGIEEIKAFIDNVVLFGKDRKSEDRSEYIRRYLIPPFGKTVAENTYNDIVKSLFEQD